MWKREKSLGVIIGLLLIALAIVITMWRSDRRAQENDEIKQLEELSETENKIQDSIQDKREESEPKMQDIINEIRQKNEDREDITHIDVDADSSLRFISNRYSEKYQQYLNKNCPECRDTSAYFKLYHRGLTPAGKFTGNQ